MDVTLLARGNRLTELQKNGLRFSSKGTVQHERVRVIEKLEDHDIYDFIFVPVRYDQAESALEVIRNNQSKTVVTLTNTVGYDSWLAIVGDRLLPGFPGAGGDMKDGILNAKFGSKSVQGTVFGEINGEKTDRIMRLAQLLEAAHLPYEIADNIQAFHVSHATTVISMKHFYTADGLVDLRTAKSRRVLRGVAMDMKRNGRMVEQAGISLTPAKMKIIGKLPAWLIALMFRIMLNIRFTRDVLLGNHALAARPEVMMMDSAFRAYMASAQY
ncbi:ketopantoate reductase family protein [Paenibacillus rhizoplanae]